MSARHFLRHLAIAYNHFYPVGEQKKFDESLESFERRQVKSAILEHLGMMEQRCHSAMAESASEELLRMMHRIRTLQRKIELS